MPLSARTDLPLKGDIKDLTTDIEIGGPDLPLCEYIEAGRLWAESEYFAGFEAAGAYLKESSIFYSRSSGVEETALVEEEARESEAKGEETRRMT